MTAFSSKAFNRKIEKTDILVNTDLKDLDIVSQFDFEFDFNSNIYCDIMVSCKFEFFIFEINKNHIINTNSAVIIIETLIKEFKTNEHCRYKVNDDRHSDVNFNYEYNDSYFPRILKYILIVVNCEALNLPSEEDLSLKSFEYNVNLLYNNTKKEDVNIKPNKSNDYVDTNVKKNKNYSGTNTSDSIIYVEAFYLLLTEINRLCFDSNIGCLFCHCVSDLNEFIKAFNNLEKERKQNNLSKSKETSNNNYSNFSGLKSLTQKKVCEDRRNYINNNISDEKILDNIFKNVLLNKQQRKIILCDKIANRGCANIISDSEKQDNNENDCDKEILNYEFSKIYIKDVSDEDIEDIIKQCINLNDIEENGDSSNDSLSSLNSI